MFREYSYIHATPHNRASFVRLFWKCYRQIGKKGGICYFRFTPFYFSWSRHHYITVVSVFIFKPDKDRREIFILLLLILSNKNIFFSFYIALFSISWNGNHQFDYRFLTQMFCEERTHSQLNMRAKFLIENHTQF